MLRINLLGDEKKTSKEVAEKQSGASNHLPLDGLRCSYNRFEDIKEQPCPLRVRCGREDLIRGWYLLYHLLGSHPFEYDRAWQRSLGDCGFQLSDTHDRPTTTALQLSTVGMVIHETGDFMDSSDDDAETITVSDTSEEASATDSPSLSPVEVDLAEIPVPPTPPKTFSSTSLWHRRPSRPRTTERTRRHDTRRPAYMSPVRHSSKRSRRSDSNRARSSLSNTSEEDYQKRTGLGRYHNKMRLLTHMHPKQELPQEPIENQGSAGSLPRFLTRRRLAAMDCTELERSDRRIPARKVSLKLPRRSDVYRMQVASRLDAEMGGSRSSAVKLPRHNCLHCVLSLGASLGADGKTVGVAHVMEAIEGMA